MAVYGITYEEGTNTGYKLVDISYDNLKKEKKFDSGNFLKDWYDLIKWINFADLNEPVIGSSSVDHFIMDGAPYDSAYLKIDDDKKPYLSYEYDYRDEGIEFFVPKGTQPTWEELRKLCDDE